MFQVARVVAYAACCHLMGLEDRAAHLGVSLRLLDGFDLSCGGSIDVPPGAQRLVAFVALHERPVPRSFVVAKLWPDTSERYAQASLRTELHRLRSGCSTELVRASRTHVLLDMGVLVDVHAQRTAVEEVERVEVALAGGDLVARLSGELLPGWYDEWVLIERERLRNRRMHALEKLCRRFSDACDHAAAIDAALAALSADPLRDTAHRALLEAYLIEGNRSDAERHWRLYRRLIRQRFQREPAFTLDELLSVYDGALTAA
jgi:DNA-binding SARP family transcriptional activator